jgi:serine/threonine-protein kinase
MLGTAAATAPVPDAEQPAAARRRWLVPVLAVLVLAVAATAAGIWYGGRNGTTPTNTGPSSSFKLYPVPATATSTEAGVVKLDFADASGLPGFDSYVIWRDRVQIDQVRPGAAPPYLLRGVDPGTEYCYYVWALVETEASPPLPPPPSCVTAKGS